MADHVHMMISIPPKFAVSQVIGYSFNCMQLLEAATAPSTPRAIGGLNEDQVMRFGASSSFIFRQNPKVSTSTLRKVKTISVFFIAYLLTNSMI